MEIKLLFLAFLVMLCVSSTRLIYHDGVIRNLGRLGRHCKMLAVLIVSTVVYAGSLGVYAGSLGVEIRQECFQLIQEQEERIRQIVAAKQIRDRVDFVMTTRSGTRYEFGDSYGVRRVPGADVRSCERDRRGDSTTGEPEGGANGYHVWGLHALHDLFEQSRWTGSPIYPADSTNEESNRF